jgi:hypothetical protein
MQMEMDDRAPFTACGTALNLSESAGQEGEGKRPGGPLTLLKAVHHPNPTLLVQIMARCLFALGWLSMYQPADKVVHESAQGLKIGAARKQNTILT